MSLLTAMMIELPVWTGDEVSGHWEKLKVSCDLRLTLATIILV